MIVRARPRRSRSSSAGIELGRGVLDGARHGRRLHAHGVVPHAERRGVFGEIACRPGGARVVDQMNYTSDIDLFREWARVACWHDVRGLDTTRKYNVGIVFKRAQGPGPHHPHRRARPSSTTGTARTSSTDTLLRPGTPRRDWKQTLLSDGFIVVRHPDLATCTAMAEAAGTDIQMYARLGGRCGHGGGTGAAASRSCARRRPDPASGGRQRSRSTRTTATSPPPAPSLGWCIPSLTRTSAKSNGLTPSRHAALTPYSSGCDRRWWCV